MDPLSRTTGRASVSAASPPRGRETRAAPQSRLGTGVEYGVTADPWWIPAGVVIGALLHQHDLSTGL